MFPKRWSFSQKALFYICIVLVAAIAVFLIIDYNIKPVVLDMAEGSVRYLAVEAINQAVMNVMMGKDIKYTDLINVLQDNEGKISMLQANTIRMNELGSLTALEAQNNINKVGSQGIKIPIGSVIGGQLLAGQGPRITVKIIPVGSVTTDFVTEFQNAGINQTKHKIYLKVKANVQIVVPTGSKKVEVASQVPIAETIIVGSVPNSYVNVDETDKMLNLVPDDE